MTKWLRCILLSALLMLALGATALAAGDGNTAYRALLVGIDGYQTNALSGCVTDANRMLAALQAANEAGAIYQTPTIRTNLKTADLSALLDETAGWGVDDDDVTLFFFAGHGYVSDKGIPSLVGTDAKALRLDRVKSALDALGGTKLIVLDCRYADSLIAKSGESAQDMLARFNQAAVEVFSSDAYYVLTSSTTSASVDAAAVDGSAHGLTSFYLTEACGYDYEGQLAGDLLGDADGNGAVSFQEALDYIDENVQALAQSGTAVTHEARVYPEDTSYPLIARRAATEVLSVALDRTETAVAVDYTTQLKAEVSPANASRTDIRWSSSNLAVATVDDDGTITGLREGTADIVATAANGVLSKCRVTVRDITFVEHLEMPLARLVLGQEASYQMELTLDPPEADETLAWSSSDTAVATVDQNGQITARSIGAAVVTVTSESGQSAECAVQVVAKDKMVTGVQLKETKIELYEGNAQQIECRITPADAAEPGITWISTDPGVAMVNESGLLVAERAGTVTLTAMASSGVSASCEVRVKSAEIVIKPALLALKPGASQALKAALEPAGIIAEISWSSSDESVATVDGNGKVTAVALGTADVTAQTESGITAVCRVSVVETQVKKVALSKEAVGLTVGQTTELKSKVAPSNASIKTLTWTSSDETVATVDENGKITAVGVGRTVISATAHNGENAKCKVQVKAAPVKKITLNETSATLTVGMEGEATLQLIAETDPVSAGNRSVQWKSSDSKIATVDENGLVTAKSAGKVTIRAMARNGKVKADCRVTVQANSANYKKPVVGTDKQVYTSARRIYYKGGYLVVELYLANRTGATVRLPEPGTLVLTLADGSQLELMEIEQGKKQLKSGKVGNVQYRFKLSENEQLSGLDLREATAAIVPDGATAEPAAEDAFEGADSADEPAIGDAPDASDAD